MKKNQNQVLNELQDVSKNGKFLPWKDKKKRNILLSLIYEFIDEKKSFRLKDCATQIVFNVLSDGSKKLDTANFCRVRLCPMCTWRRGLKIFAHTTKIMQGMESEKEYGYIFLTLTIKNITGENLSSSIDKMFQGWKRFMERKAVDSIVKGWYRGLEITHNLNRDSKDFDTFHPHFHCVFAVNKNYFTNKSYLSQKEWQQLWKESMRLDYDPQVDIRRVKGNTARAVSEIAKYAVKDTDYIIPDDIDLSIETVKILDSALYKRRLVAYGKKFKEWHKKLNLDDTEDGDLNRTGLEDDNAETTGEKIIYSWNVGYQNYFGN